MTSDLDSRPGRQALWLAVATIALVVGSCTVSTNEDPVAVGNLFDPLVETTTTSTSVPENATKLVTEYLLRTSDGATELVPVEREVDVDAGIEEVLRNLFTVPPGPDRPPEEAGLSSAISEPARLIDAELSPGTSRLVVNVSGLFGSSGGSGLRNALAQIVWTATESPEITEVSFLDDGEPQNAIVGSGDLVAGAVNRNDYRTLS